jgi:hypothetical protein
MAKNITLADYTDIEVYNMVRSGVIKRFPNGFWEGLDAFKTAKDLTRYMYERILKWGLEDIKNNAITDNFYDNRLGGMLKNLFNGNVLDALLNAYPELEEWIESKRRKEREEKAEKQPKEKKVKEIIEKVERIQYTDEELIEKLQEKAKELNRNPVMREMSEPEGHVYATRFGTWNKALMIAELIEDILSDVDDSSEAISNAQKKIKDFAYKIERQPTKEEVDNLFTEGEIKAYFGSFAAIQDYLYDGYTVDELKDILIDKRNKLGRNPINKDIKFPRAIVFIDKFDSWENALKEAGLE